MEMEKNEYEKITSLIENKRRFGKKTGVEISRCFLEKLNHPEKGMKLIHIAGTNGKGSTAAFISSILTESGFKTGLFTSPHLVHFTERIRINMEEISCEDTVRLGKEVLQKTVSCEGTMFDYCLAMALLYFKEQKCDYVILETGLGGRLDSTNAVGEVPKVCIITNIGLDHTQILGDTLEKIAAEKAGILKTGTTAIIGEMEEKAAAVIRCACQKKQIPWIMTDPEKGMDVNRKKNNYVVKTTDKIVKNAILGLEGEYQKSNAKNAVAAVLTLRENAVTEETVRDGLKKAWWPGRMEKISDDPFILLDGAHNPQGTAALAGSLQMAWPDEKFVFVVGVLADKDYGGMLIPMLPLASVFITVTVENKRALQGKKLAELIQKQGTEAVATENITEAMQEAENRIKKKRQKIVVFGSLYFIGELEKRKEIRNNRNNGKENRKI